MEWLGLKHPMLVHLPLAAALLLPLPLLLAQRAGRGIRPWWVTCRYLAWTGFLALLLSVLSGFAWAKGLGLLTDHGWLGAPGSPLRRHQAYAAASLLLGLPTLWALHRRRKDHEGLGWSAFLFGTLFAIATLVAGQGGHRMAHGKVTPIQPVATKAEVPPVTAQDPEQERPVRALDFAALQPIQSDLVRAQAHGRRFVRTWVSPAGAAAFAANQPLPPGSFVVLASQEARWGRPGPEAGPLWAYEVGRDGHPSFQAYWAHVPEGHRGDEFEGQAKVYWRKDAPQLQSCTACHGNGPSDPSARARFRAR